MAVATGYVGSAAITWSASATATVTSQSIGTASWGRIVLVAVTVEETATIDSCTIGGVAANVAISVRNTTGTPDNACAFFWLPVPSGTTANVVVTLSASSSQTGRISVWAITGAHGVVADSNSAQGAGATQTLGGVTIATNGAGFWVFNNATTGTAVAWTNATERDDTSVGNYRHSVADTTTAGTPTVTADAATTNQILAGVSFSERPPGGWDVLPQMEKPPFPPMMASLAIAAHAGLIFPPYPYTIEAIPDFTHASTTTNFAFAKNLYYQAKIAPPPREPDVAPVPPFGWHQALSKAAPATALSLSNLTHVLAPVSQPYTVFSTTSTYLSVRVLYYQDKFEVLAVAEAVVETTPDQWMPRWEAAKPSGQPPATLASPFVPREATSENTVDISYWLQPFYKAVPRPDVWTGGSPFIPKEATRENTVTPDKWLQSWRGPPSYQPIPSQYTPFVPAEATRENTVTPDKWLQAWRGPPNYSPPAIAAQPFVPTSEVADNTRFEWDWSIQWQGPPRYLQRLQPGSPFVPEEATSENTVTVEKWLFRFQKAVPVPPVWRTQPFYGFPYEGVDNTRTEWDWYLQWRGPPRYWWQGRPFQPFVPPAATRENTVTPEKWMQRWYGPQRRPVARSAAQQFVPTAFPQFTVAWQQPLSRAIERKRAPYQQTVRGEAFVADNTVTIDKWLQRLSRAVAGTKLRFEKWHYQVPQPIVVAEEEFTVFSIKTSFVATSSLFYQDLFAPLTVPEVVVPPVVVPPKTWIPDGAVSGAWTPDAGKICTTTVEIGGAFQEDAFQEDAFQVSGETTAVEVECWTVDVAVENEWTQDEPDP